MLCYFLGVELKMAMKKTSALKRKAIDGLLLYFINFLFIIFLLLISVAV